MAMEPTPAIPATSEPAPAAPVAPATPELAPAAAGSLLGTPAAEPPAAPPVEPPPAEPAPVEITYEAFKLPEGLEIDEKAMGEASVLFKDSKLSQEQAQKFIDLATARETAAANRSAQAYADLQTKWHGEVMSDPEIGGPKWEASKAASDRIMDRLNIPGLREALNLTGAGNHPAIVKAFVRLGQMVSEDKILSGSAAPKPANSGAPNWYGDGPKQSADA